MARSPSDATRFTATGPYASSPTGTPQFGTQIDFGSAPAGETPQQKIARLRAAATAARRGKESQFDTVVRVGRVWADRAHRVTAVGLIGLTVLSGAVATAGITDMLLHNRRRRNEWLADQQAKSARDLAEAKQARAAGRATEDQMLLINREVAAAAAVEAKKANPGILKKTTGWLFGGLSTEEQKGGRLGAEAAATARAMADGSGKATHVQNEGPLGQQHDRNVLQAVEDKIIATRRQGERAEVAVNPRGGPLDQQAALATTALSDTGRSWKSWLTGR